MSDRFTEMVREFTGGAWRLIARITGDPELARDLTQDVMLKMLTRADRLRDPVKLKSYLFRSAYNTALNATRGRKRREQAHASYAAEAPGHTHDDPLDLIDQQRNTDRLNRAVAKLADRQREVVTLRFYGGLTLAEIATTLKVSEGTAKVHLARALQNLRTILAPVAGEEV